VKKVLEDGLRGMMNPETSPSSLQEAASRWSSLYHSYAQSAIAGVVLPTTLNLALIKIPLSGPGMFLQNLSAGIEAYWMGTLWVSPGFTGVTANASGLATTLIPIGTSLATSINATVEQSATRYASAIDAYTKTVRVIVTNVTSGVTSPAFLS